jgi:hypothetical protein
MIILHRRVSLSRVTPGTPAKEFHRVVQLCVQQQQLEITCVRALYMQKIDGGVILANGVTSVVYKLHLTVTNFIC